VIELARAPKPPVLVANEVAWNAEYVEWSEHRIGTEPRRYAHPEIRAVLAADTASKCAYCEGLVNDVSYVHIEHQLPKKHHPALVCEWSNLTLGCPRCNTSKGQYDDPECPLLDPYSDDVENDLAFGGPLALPRGGARARTTINTLELNRLDLLHSRSESLRRLDDLLDFIERVREDLELTKSLWTDIDRLTAADAEFASASRYFVRAQCAERGLVRP
jgi:uncharacterized protein (TIGR02646 family)